MILAFKKKCEVSELVKQQLTIKGLGLRIRDPRLYVNAARIGMQLDVAKNIGPVVFPWLNVNINAYNQQVDQGEHLPTNDWHALKRKLLKVETKHQAALSGGVDRQLERNLVSQVNRQFDSNPLYIRIIEALRVKGASDRKSVV